MTPETQQRAPLEPAAGNIAIGSLNLDGAKRSQSSLFDPPDVRSDDPETSAAAAVMSTSHRLWLKDRVLELLQQGDATDDELAQLLPAEHTGSVSKRRCDLVRAGLVVDTGKRRPTRRGAQAAVWAVVDAVGAP
jgi:hypothetical protein